MEDQFRELLHTHPSCPFCGHPVDVAALSGLNCSVCRPCYEAITFWTPSYAKIFTDDGVFEIWDYIPVAETWQEANCANAIFLDPQPDVRALNEETRQMLVAFTENRYQEVFERAHRNKVNEEILTLQVPKPIIVTGNWIYAKDVESVKQSGQEQRTQATLSESV
ncbi:hypothetical protein [Halosimplex pelagicum]|uniref:Uncharacterized protein n=1 Tax=Halosimplex pelagicum TaxID=869886 RepID=A0A7D5T9X9_9EURY|nr:hypothetical protein [Halosimplex pelagicum]QLH82310.1 hypothetical protein HZS54_12105 [Halosimplex pelagicum]